MPAREFADTRRVRTDVTKAFAGEEPPTRPTRLDARRLMREADDTVTACVSLETVPELVVERTDVCWHELSQLAAELVLRIDGASHTMAVVMGTSSTPAHGVRELATLVRLGLVRLVSPRHEDAPEIEVESVSFA